MRLLRWILVATCVLASVGATPTPEEQERIDALTAKVAQSEADGSPAGIVALSQLLRLHRQLGDETAEAATLAHLARHMRRFGRYRDALSRLEEATTLDKKNGNGAALAADTAELANTWAALGNARKAAKLHRDAAKQYQALAQPRGTADALVALAVDQRALGDLTAAEASLGKALGLYEAVGDDSGRGDALTNLASLEAASGRYSLAVRHGREAVDAFAASKDDEGRGVALHNLGNLHARLGDLDQAASLARQARPLLRGPERRAADLVVTDLLLAAGRTDDAIALVDASLKSTPDDALLLFRRWQATDDAAALASFLAAARTSDDPQASLLGTLEGLRTTPPTRSSRAALGALAKDATAKGLPSLALDALLLAGEHARAAGVDPLPPLHEAAEQVETMRRGAEALDPAAGRRLVRSQRAVYEALIDALLAAGDGASALLYAERLRQAELGASTSTDPDAQRLASLGEREAELEAVRREAQANLDAGLSDDRLEAIDAELAELRVAFSRTVDELRTAHPDFELLVKVDPADIEAWQGDLGDDEVVLQPILLPDRLVVLVFSSGPLVARTIDVDPAEVRKRVSRVLRTLRSQRTGNSARLHEHLDALGGWIWAPVADLLAERRRVAVIPSGALRYLPFQLLRHEGKYLVEEHEVVNVTNVGSLKRRNEGPLRLYGTGLLAFGNPDGSLPAADTEVDAIAALFPGARSAHGTAATRSLLEAEAPKRAVVHLATHGVLDPQAPERSYIVLAAEDDDAGHLGYLEIPGLFQSLRGTRLVVLSACETAVPLEAPPTDGTSTGLEIAGLANQFRRAGVPRLLASLWQVSDASTQALMVRFYEGLGQGRSAPEALAAAQRAMLADEATAHPFHWAPFVLIGAPR
ncbi:MAG: CHAT domain-containing protein [Deltaproteobacteria bacterium]|nr:CHAT domain-containing protein [Deltaproteobacteria bacterium]